MLNEEARFRAEGYIRIVGIDEAGRGPWAGPVVAAACLLPPDFRNDLINDSKKLSPKKREALYPLIVASALAYGIAFVDAETIDRLNIYEATKRAMLEALGQINVPYDLILTDAMPLKGAKTPLIPIVKGDAKALNIAAASILAKVARDRYMTELDRRYPGYGFAAHKGYGTKEHLMALEKLGPITGVHRMSYAPLKRLHFTQGTLF